MRVLKTLVVLLLMMPAPGRATDDPLLRAFASCAGRFSAELEHAWLLNDTRASEFEAHRSAFIDLLNATVPTDQLRRTLHIRIDAKVAHAGLLTQATFSPNQRRALWAVRRAESEIGYCTGFLLKS